MSTTEDRRTTDRLWREAWRQLSPVRRASVLVRWSLVVAFMAGGLAVVVAYVHGQDLPPAVKVGLDVVATVFIAGMVVHDAEPPLDPSDPALAPTVVHAIAGMLAMALVPWIFFAGQLGADLSTRPELYGQVAQIIPVLLLAVIFERRFFPVGGGSAGDEQFVMRAGFVLLVAGPALAEVFALLAIASHVRWIEVAATVLAASTIPGLLVLIAGPVLIALYAPADEPAAAEAP
ncbi:MAG TPA: hypothetical protein VFG42_18345 [Baekduia sp.]|uniref:hypothetical protein n=1 Tax=Baekduia sp. TaxID=2600305 RepID=UPI002D7849FF|nr:hypothetical protein [Baekduia sp.]HET6508760.1 hypothetical protein [Baekduia sp.]